VPSNANDGFMMRVGWQGVRIICPAPPQFPDIIFACAKLLPPPGNAKPHKKGKNSR